MNSISDYDVYTARMQKTYYDKCWWINHIPGKVNTIIDFGCADAGIYNFIDNMYPGRFTYIGVDANEEMLRIARKEYEGNARVSFYRSLKELNGFSQENTVMILNSVMHELFTYSNHIEVFDFIADVRKTSPAYIAVRDMHKVSPTIKFDWNLENNPYQEQYLSYKEVTDFDEADINFSLEFLLKYLYPENWSREVIEKYLWNWSDFFENTLEKDIVHFGEAEKMYGYIRKYEEDFSIRFLQEKWKEDFGIEIDIPTHKKVLLIKKED
ncbi:MAG: hypothetical protein IKY78_06230 [Clostridia bacterium]|nr:hypothetical protein [Clostridia bacterium]